MSPEPPAVVRAPAIATLALDTSALLRRYIDDQHRPLVVDAMMAAPVWAASALARSELMLTLHQAATDPLGQRSAWAAVRDDWEAVWEIPVDNRCLARATEIGARYGITLTAAIHLAAASRLPEPITFCTLDRRQIPAAADLGFALVSPSDR
jgi:predicted nucleic acid-binding protein